MPMQDCEKVTAKPA